MNDICLYVSMSYIIWSHSLERKATGKRKGIHLIREDKITYHANE